MEERQVVCEPEQIILTLETLKNNSDKAMYIKQVLETCSICEEPEGKGKQPKKSKRVKRKDKGKRMSSWICYLKTCLRRVILIVFKTRRERKNYTIPRKTIGKNKQNWDAQRLSLNKFFL